MKSNLIKLAEFFCIRSGSSGVLVITNSPDNLRRLPSGIKIFVASENLEQKDMPKKVEFINLESVDADFLADKVLLCMDFLEGKKAYGNVSRTIRKIQSLAVFSVIAISSDSNWKESLFNRFYGNKFAALQGVEYGHLIAVGGIASNIYKIKSPPVPVLAFVPVYNEFDIIEKVILHLLEQSVDVYVIDNWSNDGSYEKVIELTKKYPNRISMERYPKLPNDKYEWGKILSRISSLSQAENNKRYRWFMLNDADEIRWSPWRNITLGRAFSFIDHLGYNSVDFTLFNFVPVTDGFNSRNDPKEFFDHGEFPKAGWALLQIKAWKNVGSVDLASSGSHHAKIKDQMIYPIKFLLAHYPLRSEEQARRKVFKERKPRFTTAERKKGWSRHYDNMDADYKFIKSRDELIEFDDSFYSRYILERISGIGIITEK